MKRRSSPESKLEQLINEARAEKPAHVRFASVEEGLLREVLREAPVRARPTYKLAGVALAAAACAALWSVGGQRSVTAPESRPVFELSDPPHRDGEALGVGARVIAAEHAVSVSHAGRATWQLAPKSSAVLVEKAGRIALRLERGSLEAQVVPSSKPETFVVEAAGTRVAVHGTVFRVSLEGERVAVRVNEGVVAVGPGSGEPMFWLRAPAHGDFAADGLSGNVDGQSTAPLPTPRSGPHKAGRLRPVPSASALSAEASAAPSASAELPREPSIDDIESGIARSLEVTADCFSRHTRSADGVRVTVRTALDVHITGEGKATNVQFRPPLSPDAEACALAGIASIAFAPSELGAQVTRMLELKR